MQRKSLNHNSNFFPFAFLIAILSLAIFANCASNYTSQSNPDGSITEENQPTKDHCNLKPDRGPCRGMFKGYFFDSQTKTCKEFTYGGCKGTLPFASRQDCERLCK